MKLRTVINICIILSLGLVVNLWLQGKLLYFWDEVFPFNPSKDMYYYSFAWFKLFNHGQGSAAHNIIMIPYFSIIYFFHNILNLSLYNAQFLLVYILFTSSGLSMYFFISYIMNHYFDIIETDNIATLSGSLIYMFNLYTMPYLLFSIWPSWFLYSFSPLAILVLLKGLTNASLRIFSVKYVVSFMFLIFLMTPGFFEGPYLLYFLALCFIFSIPYFSLILKTEKRIGIIAFIFLVIVSVVLTNLWWILPLFSLSMAQAYSRAVGEWTTTVNEALYYASKQSALNLLRGIPPNLTPDEREFGAGWPWALLYFSHPLLVAASIIPSLVSFLPFLDKNSIKKQLNICGATLFLLFYASMPQTLLNLLLKYRLTPLIYSYFYHFIGYPLSFLQAILFSEGIFLLLYKKVTTRFPLQFHRNTLFFKLRTIITLIVIILSVLIYPWPLWTPYATPSFVSWSGVKIPSITTIPKYYWDMADYLDKLPEDTIVLALPPTPPIKSVKFDEGGFIDTHDFFSYASGKSIAGFLYAGEDELYYPLIKILDFNVTTFAKYLTVLGVKYVLVNTEVSESPGSAGYPYNFSHILSFLKQQRDIKLIKNLGPLWLFENQQTVKMIYATNALYFNLQPGDFYFLVTSDKFVPLKQAVISERKFLIREFYQPNITYQEINPTLYEVYVKNATTPYILVFNQRFDNGWVAYINGTSIDSHKHFIANYFANAWFIERKGDYTVTLVYSPQRTLELAIKVSEGSSAVLFAILFIGKVYLKLKT